MNAGVGSLLRAGRFVAFIAVLWLLTSLWGRRDRVLLQWHIVCLTAIIAMVAVGGIIAPGKARAVRRAARGRRLADPPDPSRPLRRPVDRPPRSAVVGERGARAVRASTRRRRLRRVDVDPYAHGTHRPHRGRLRGDHGPRSRPPPRAPRRARRRHFVLAARHGVHARRVELVRARRIERTGRQFQWPPEGLGRAGPNAATGFRNDLRTRVDEQVVQRLANRQQLVRGVSRRGTPWRSRSALRSSSRC